MSSPVTWDDEGCEINLSTKTKGRVDFLLQIEELPPQYPFDDINTAKNSTQVNG